MLMSVTSRPVAIPLQFILLLLLACAGASAHKLYDVLVENGLTEYAEFDRKNPSAFENSPTRTVFAPTNEAIRAFLASGDNTSPHRLVRRFDSRKQNANSRQNNNNGSPMGSSPGRRRDVVFITEEFVINTGTDTITPGGNKVVSNPGTNSNAGDYLLARTPGTSDKYVAEVASGAASISRIIKANIPFEKGYIHIVDRYCKSLTIRYNLHCWRS